MKKMYAELNDGNILEMKGFREENRTVPSNLVERDVDYLIQEWGNNLQDLLSKSKNSAFWNGYLIIEYGLHISVQDVTQWWWEDEHSEERP